MNLSDSPLLEAEELRVDLGGAVALERVSFTKKGPSLVISLETTALMSALAGATPVRAGTLHLFGRDVGKREHLDLVGLSPLDPPLPPKWTALDYLRMSAQLLGLPKGSAGRLAREALGMLDASSLTDARLGNLGIAERRVLVLAHAIVGQPAVLIAALPLAGLSGAPGEYVLRAFERATRDRAWIASVARADAGSLEHALLEAADDNLAFTSGRLFDRGQLEVMGAARSYALTVRRHAEALRQCLASRGIELRGGPSQFWVSLPKERDPSELFAASIEAEAPIVQLRPREGC